MRATLAKGYVIVVGFVCGLWTASGNGADLLDIYDLAHSADPELRSADFDHQASREILVQAKSGYLPAVTFSFDHTETEQRIRDSDNVLFQAGRSHFPTDVITLSLTQPVFRYANYIRIKQARSELKQADAELAKSEQELMLRVAETYLHALAAEDNVDYLTAERAAVEKQLTLAQAMEKAKLGRRSDRLEAEARLAAVTADYAEAEVNRRDTYEAIYELTGEFPERLDKLQKEFPLTRPDPFDVQHWTAAAREQNWKIEGQRQAVDVARQEISRQRAGHLPTLDLQLRESIKDQGGTVFGGGSEVENRDVMLNLNVPPLPRRLRQLQASRGGPQTSVRARETDPCRAQGKARNGKDLQLDRQLHCAHRSSAERGRRATGSAQAETHRLRGGALLQPFSARCRARSLLRQTRLCRGALRIPAQRSEVERRRRHLERGRPDQFEQLVVALMGLIRNSRPSNC